MINWSDIEVEKRNNEVVVSFRNHGALSLLKSDYVIYRLKEIIRKKNIRLIIDVKGVHFIDSRSMDVLNLISRISQKYNSTVVLTGVEPEVMELIQLARQYAIFDIKRVEAAMENNYQE